MVKGTRCLSRKICVAISDPSVLFVQCGALPPRVIRDRGDRVRSSTAEYHSRCGRFVGNLRCVWVRVGLSLRKRSRGLLDTPSATRASAIRSVLVHEEDRDHLDGAAALSPFRTARGVPAWHRKRRLLVYSVRRESGIGAESSSVPIFRGIRTDVAIDEDRDSRLVGGVEVEMLIGCLIGAVHAPRSYYTRALLLTGIRSSPAAP